MLLVKPSYKILFISPNPLKTIEEAGRICYKSEDKISIDSAKKFTLKIINRGHHSVIEHAYMSAKFICDRGVSHEIVRHRLAAYSQESTRYCNYKGGVAFVIPPWLPDIQEGEYDWPKQKPFNTPATSRAATIWLKTIALAEIAYANVSALGWSPQQARCILPHSLKTELVMTCNLREWRHILKLRVSKNAQPQMRELMLPFLKEVKTLIPIIFDDIKGE